jgi:hypothetical protein
VKRTIEWATGLFEGEGTIIIRRREYGGRTLQISVYSTDREVLDEFDHIVQTGNVCGPYVRDRASNLRKQPRNPKPLYQWYAYGIEAQKVLSRMLPYLFSRRRKKAQEAIRLSCKKRVSPCRRSSPAIKG